MNRTLPHPAPTFWRNETGGELQPAIERYLKGESLTLRDVSLMGAYLRQWVDSPLWEQNLHMEESGRLGLSVLRFQVKHADTVERIDACIKLAVEMGMDPL